jgi:4-amino-4-deoxy-L-arabinose transferase-like glycosyltransferase
MFSTEQTRAGNAIGRRLAGNLATRPSWSEEVFDRWRAFQDRVGSAKRSDGGGTEDGASNPARVNPPLYYGFEAVPYVLSPSSDPFSRIFLMRLWSMLLLLVAVAATWMLIGELAGRRRDLQFAGAAIVGLQPMATFISASVNPDSAIMATFALAFWLGARTVRRGLEPRTAVALCAATAAAILIKATGYALVPGVLVALAIGAWKAGIPRRAGQLARTAAPLLVLALPVLAWVAYSRLSDRPVVNEVGRLPLGTPETSLPGPVSYLWQFYLPNLSGQQPLPSTFPGWPARNFWLEGFWGDFGWLEIRLPNSLYLAAAALTALIAAGAVIALVRSGWRRHLPLLAFIVLIVGAVFGGLHLTEFRTLERQGTPFIQGRYLLPLAPLLGLAAAAALSLLRGRLRQGALGLLTGALLALQIASLVVVAERFYA